ncbi:motility quorum-sensing regulator / GCU-specific mRNA interferase toxin [Pseudomonas sp. ok272]|uniref:type II toxin-antitoxin system MqsR family toxin n=1 Tax=unclassified Pseudomonas TaxID=196821 RepID=UPI0008B2588E|nr:MULTISPECIES: type II toxin-antitoxin system MqsR family toxin [unclassified Pseudomonas]SEM32129.1 motility quorum-sensing regulator / GCU-specific mRNA interferase toxin [Pseudomonas sp. ok272]SFM32073.1 motility quorum-sensing regulator / GCU-specific mRNA interferase toxin [Pseudomonas sp. ok602]
MDKNTPHYDLRVVKAQVVLLGKKAFTRSALESGRDIGLSYPSMVQVIAALERRMLYKSMTSYDDHRRWHDVYHTTFRGLQIYIKVTYRPGGGPPVISFKEKDQ